MPINPKAILEKIQRMLNGWETLAPDKSFGGFTLTQFREVAKPSLEARAHIEDLEAQTTQATNNRDTFDEEFLEKAQLVVNGVLADPTEGPNSALYEAFGYTPKRERKSGLTRRPKNPPPAK
jgi:hypothetical protein